MDSELKRAPKAAAHQAHLHPAFHMLRLLYCRCAFDSPPRRPTPARPHPLSPLLGSGLQWTARVGPAMVGASALRQPSALRSPTTGEGRLSHCQVLPYSLISPPPRP